MLRSEGIKSSSECSVIHNNLAERLLILKSLIITGDFLRIKLTSLYVDDQEKALKFYTEMLGFIKKADISAGGYRWLTVVSP